MNVDPRDRPDSRERSPVGSRAKVRVGVVSSGAVILAACVAAGAFAFLYRQSSMTVPTDIVRELDDDGRNLVSKWQRDSCNRSAATDLASQLIKHDEFSFVAEMYNFQQLKCKTADELEPMLFSAQMGLSNYKAAVLIAEDLVHRFPADPTTYGWRAQAREKTGDISGAYVDMKRALGRFPERSNVDVSVFYDTARLAASSGHPCDATIIIRDYIAMDYTHNKTQQLETLMDEWRQAGHCPEASGRGESEIKYNKEAGEFVVQVDINGIPAKMIVDTGATEMMLTENFARRAGVQIDVDSPAMIATAGGVAAVAPGHANKVTLGRSTLEDVSMFVEPDVEASYGAGIDGLLGMSFLGNFDIQLANGIMHIRPR